MCQALQHLLFTVECDSRGVRRNMRLWSWAGFKPVMSRELGMCLMCPAELPGRHNRRAFREILTFFKLHQNLSPPRCFLMWMFGYRVTTGNNNNTPVWKKGNQITGGLKKKKWKIENPDAFSVPPELDVRFWADQCNSVLLLFLYGLYCDTALGT